MMDYRLQLMAGVDIPIPDLQLTMHPPVVKDIAYMGEQQFFMALQYLCLEKESLIQDESLLSSLSNFQVLVKVLDQSQDKTKKSAVMTLFQLLFPKYSAVMTKNSIILNEINGEHTVMIDANNFGILQEVTREVLCVNSIFQGDNIIYNPANARAKEIADKIMRGRMKVAEQKNKNSNDSILTRYISILTVAGVVSLDQCIQCNLFQLFDLMERYTNYVEWDTDLRVKLAGGKPDKEVENWMRDLHSNSPAQKPSGPGSDLVNVYKK